MMLSNRETLELNTWLQSMDFFGFKIEADWFYPCVVYYGGFY